MDALTLSRLQFAVTAMFHFIFVPLTLGLGWLTAWFETRYARTGDARYLSITRFWKKAYVRHCVLWRCSFLPSTNPICPCAALLIRKLLINSCLVKSAVTVLSRLVRITGSG